MKLSKADTARHLKISRQTLYEWIRHGRISVDNDGTIDSAEVARLSGSVSKPDVASTRQSGQLLTSAQPDMVDVYREVIDLLKTQLEESQRREAHYRELADRLTAMLADSQAQSQRLLDMPRQVPSTVLGHQRKAPAIPETWQRVLDFMVQQKGTITAGQVKEALGLRTDARHVLKRMMQRGLIERVEPGVYTIGPYTNIRVTRGKVVHANCSHAMAAC